MSEGRPSEDTREENTERNPSLASHSASTVLSCPTGNLRLSHSLILFSAIFHSFSAAFAVSAPVSLFSWHYISDAAYSQ